jgi:hypothetical protein
MNLLTENYLRKIAKTRALTLNESIPGALRKSMTASAARSSFHIFLSHSYLDRELVLGITSHLEELGFIVYVDWKEDPQLSRQNITKHNAKLIRQRIDQSESLFFATTAGAKESRWMPWELGCMDGKNGRAAILPVSQGDISTDTYRGQEYLSIYPYITRGRSNGNETVWVCEDAETYVSFNKWLEGRQPHTH